ncbi:MAG: EVE domain-containing protein [Hyphomicrobiales bacterium]|nr:EVE domain-containing protein [Hyphomicrobiales bacterium]
MKYWIGVASRDHVMTGYAGGFCQLCHGKASAVRRLRPGDWIAYYSPRTSMRGGEPVQAFTAIGRIAAGEPYPFDMGNGFVPFRRDVAFCEGQEASIRPLIDRLSFLRDKRNWAYPFRFGLLQVSRPDFELIAEAMGVPKISLVEASA